MSRRKIGEERFLVYWIDYYCNDNFPKEAIDIVNKYHNITPKVVKILTTTKDYKQLLPFNDTTFNIYNELLALATPRKPFFGYTPDLVIQGKNKQVYWIECKQNFGYLRLKNMTIYNNPSFWNFKKNFIIGWCKKNKIIFLELRYIKQKWFIYTNIYGSKKDNKKALSFDVKSFLINYTDIPIIRQS